MINLKYVFWKWIILANCARAKVKSDFFLVTCNKIDEAIYANYVVRVCEMMIHKIFFGDVIHVSCHTINRQYA